uniref:Uncharacterized protein n=1 Tax=Avena sativa TaxID=4498 RepID=A0ACD5UGP0_AVESA
MYLASAVTRLPLFLVVVSASFWAGILYSRMPTDGAVSFALTTTHRRASRDPCVGRYVFMQELPPRFNADILAGCATTEGRWSDMCEQVSNAGLGEPLAATGPDPDGGEAAAALTGATGWYATQQFALDAIFHGRMRRYRCLTNDSSAASAVFVPFYAGFEFMLHNWGYDNETRDAASRDLARWLTRSPEWRRAAGRDHFLVAGRTAWDFQRDYIQSAQWGNRLMELDAARNMTVLVVESSMRGNDMAVPYPTYFHPRTDAQVRDWQKRIRSASRPWLMSFVGAPRPDAPRNIRSEVIAQCNGSPKCQQLRCANGATQCHAPADIIRLFRRSVFCLQPPGDSYTRRSAFDAMLAGCVPVFFHPSSAYLQYVWHLPKDHARYSVFIPEDQVRAAAGNVSFIEETLSRIPPATVREMQAEVVRLVPGLVYADPRHTLDTVKDAFDLAVQGVLRKLTDTLNN